MADDLVVEIRTYRLRAGTEPAFHRVVTEQCLPLLGSFGIRVIHAGPSEAEDDGSYDYILVRAFASLASREEQEIQFYGSSQWQQGPRQDVVSRIDRYHTVVLTVPHAMVETWATQSGSKSPAVSRTALTASYFDLKKSGRFSL